MRDESPPRTPTAHKGKAPMRALDTQSLQHETTFFEDETPVDKRRSGATELSVMSRDSHDLHFRDVTRESVVDNMLLSLDSLPSGGAAFPGSFGGLYNSFQDDDEPYQSNVMRFSPPPLFRAPAHNHSASLASEYDVHDDSSSRYSSQHSRGRRSNSTNNFRSDLDRIESMGSRGYGSARMSSDTARKPLYGEGSVAQHSRGAGRKGSSSSSMDYGYSTQIIPPGSRRTNRSSSFDNGPNVFDYPTYDAAPTPTIPTGTRRTLTKKNSSFFRRRKKSVTEEPPPPPMPLQVQRVADIGSSVLPSPSSNSLRNAMKDYLGDQPTASPREMFYDTREQQSPVDDGNDHPGGFSPEYTPHKDATIRAVKPGSRGTDDSVAPAVEDVQNLHHRTQDSPKYKLKVKRGKGASGKANDDSSFLADSSEHEDKNGNFATPGKSNTITSVEVERTMPAMVSEEPTEEDREKAQQIYDGDESFVTKARAAAWLGEKTLISARCRKAYMEIYEWTGFSILLAMRDLCNRLVLKGETQEVDRVLDSFANRWCECNPNHGFKSSGAVHTICYSILLLNTDLHMADIESKMTRGQFVKNTLPTIRRVVDAEAEEANENAQNTSSRSGTPMDDPMTPISPTFENGERQSVDLNTKRSRNRLSIRPAMGLRTDSDGCPTNPDSGTGDSCTVLVKAPFEGSMKAWEFQVEVVLKEFYNSIKNSRLPLHGTETTPAQSSNNLSVGGMLRRTPSVLSKAPSDTTSYRGRHSDFRSATSRWNSKTRSRPKLYPSSTIGSSRTSLDDQSVFSPAGSSKWSSYSIGKTGTSMSVDSLGSHFVAPDYQQSIGFANALSQAIIREGNEENHTIASYEEFGRTAPLLEDESLELHGPPWAKEGILKHKHHLEAMDKKYKDRNWNEVFAVIEKGYMKIFTFSMGAKSVRSKAKRRPSTGGVVGGGNWMDNAEQLHSFLLRQVIASALPPPGYSKTRPHVFALSLPTGAVHLFQAGTVDIVKEYVQTANYWSARLSKEPLVGGVSNIEYGWSDSVINPALIGRPESSPTTTGVGMPRPSIQSSIRSSMDHGTIKARLPGDKVVLSDWTPPTQSMMASNLMEVDQHKALSAYVKNIEDELQRHQELRAPMMIAFSPRHPNAAKSMANFEKKSAYLLRELVKFKTYIDALNYANDTRDKIYAEREERLKAEESAKKEADTDANGVDKDDDDMSDPAIPQSVGRLLRAFDTPDN
ncbi:putative sec7 domain containing protein [Neofusicoccum parvum UCRNP2]|uniref:Putative sec7 domain containing protein n=1 Tax=Botryosphaeria parva (strain UCR-NP2) TaxID=1287680 RepID=R1GHZ0_BOTPV|nr:putative sec7 domain containing protein [Neofusicoccum parvum UCRNP2]